MRGIRRTRRSLVCVGPFDRASMIVGSALLAGRSAHDVASVARQCLSPRSAAGLADVGSSERDDPERVHSGEVSAEQAGFLPVARAVLVTLSVERTNESGSRQRGSRMPRILKWIEAPNVPVLPAARETPGREDEEMPDLANAPQEMPSIEEDPTELPQGSPAERLGTGRSA